MRYALLRPSLRPLPVMTVALAALFALAACGDGDEDTALQLSVRADVIPQDAPVEVEVSSPAETEEGFEHEVRVAWRGDQTARLDDARFSHHVESDGGHLVALGRGCGANWDEAAEEVFIACTADLQLILVAPGEMHAYPVRIPREVGSLRLRPGAYVIEEVIPWWLQDAIDAEPTGEGEFMIRLTYEAK